MRRHLARALLTLTLCVLGWTCVASAQSYNVPTLDAVSPQVQTTPWPQPGATPPPEPEPSAQPSSSPSGSCTYDPTSNTWSPDGCENTGVPGFLQPLNDQLAASCNNLVDNGGPLSGLSNVFQGIYDAVTFKELSGALGASVGGIAITFTGVLFAFALLGMLNELRQNARHITFRNFLVLPATKIATFFGVIIAIHVLSGMNPNGTAGPDGTIAYSLPNAGVSLAAKILDNHVVTDPMVKWGITPEAVPTRVGTIGGDALCVGYKGIIFPLVMGGRVSEAQWQAGWFQPLIDIAVALLFLVLTIIPVLAQFVALVILFFERVMLGVNGSILASLSLIMIPALVWDKTKAYGTKIFDGLLNLFVSGLVLGVFLWITLNLNQLAAAQLTSQMAEGSKSLNFGDGLIWVVIVWFMAILMFAFAFSTGKAAQQILTGALSMSTASMLSGMSAVAGLAVGAAALAKSGIDAIRGRGKEAIAPATETDANTARDTGPGGKDSPEGKADDRGPTTSPTTPPTSPDEVTPDGKTPDGKTPDGKTPDGKTPDAAPEGPLETPPDPAEERAHPGRDPGKPGAPDEAPAEAPAEGPREPALARNGPNQDESPDEKWTAAAAGALGAAGLRDRLRGAFADKRKQFSQSRTGLAARNSLRAVGDVAAKVGRVGAKARSLGHHALVNPVTAQMAHAVQAAMHGQHIHFGHTLGQNAPHRNLDVPPLSSLGGGSYDEIPSWTKDEATSAFSKASTVLPPLAAKGFASNISAGMHALDQGRSVEAASSLLAAASIAEIAATTHGADERQTLQTSAAQLRTAAAGVGGPRVTPTISRLSGKESTAPRIARRNRERLTPVQQQTANAYDRSQQLAPTSVPAAIQAGAALDIAFDAAMQKNNPARIATTINHARSLARNAARLDVANSATWRQIARELSPVQPTSTPGQATATPQPDVVINQQTANSAPQPDVVINQQPTVVTPSGPQSNFTEAPLINVTSSSVGQPVDMYSPQYAPAGQMPGLTPTIDVLSGKGSPRQPPLLRRKVEQLSPLQQRVRYAYQGVKNLRVVNNAVDARAAAALDVLLDASVRNRDEAAILRAMNDARSAALAAGGGQTPNAAMWQKIAEHLAPPPDPVTS